MEQQTLIANNLDEIKDVASSIISNLPHERIFALYGKMGAGKTTLIKALCEVLEVEEVVSSPTFALVNEYTTQSQEAIFHFDFYRIKKIEEVYDIGYEEYFYSDSYCFIEWPELVDGLLPERHVKLEIEVEPNEERLIKIKVING